MYNISLKFLNTYIYIYIYIYIYNVEMFTFVEMHTFDLSIELSFNKYILLHVI